VPTISAGERPQTYAFDRAATGTGRDAEYLSNVSVIHFVKLGFYNLILFVKRLLTNLMLVIQLCLSNTYIRGVID